MPRWSAERRAPRVTGRGTPRHGVFGVPRHGTFMVRRSAPAPFRRSAPSGSCRGILLRRRPVRLGRGGEAAGSGPTGRRSVGCRTGEHGFANPRGACEARMGRSGGGERQRGVVTPFPDVASLHSGARADGGHAAPESPHGLKGSVARSPLSRGHALPPYGAYEQNTDDGRATESPHMLTAPRACLARPTKRHADQLTQAPMLTRLSIRDIVLIDRLDIELSAGLAVLTGETGAGKSILLDAF